MTNAEYVDALDEARRDGGDWKPLEQACYQSLHPADPRKKEIVHETLIAIHKKFVAGEPSVLIAPQIGGIVRNQRLQADQRRHRMYKRLVPVGDEEQRLDGVAPDQFEPEHATVTREEFQERVEMVRAALEAIPRAPLARLIDAYLDQHNNVSTNALLRKIADLNQGRMEDLNAPAFLSYLIGKCQTDESSIVQVINMLRTFEMVLHASADGYDSDLLIAARSESDEERQLALEDLREQLRKRTK